MAGCSPVLSLVESWCWRPAIEPSTIQIQFRHEHDTDNVWAKWQRGKTSSTSNALDATGSCDGEWFWNVLLLLTFHESSAILHSRLKQLLLALLMLFVIFSLLISLPIYNNHLVVIVSSSAALCWLLFANAVCKHKCYENSLQEGIRVECEELTNRTTFATFQLVIKTIKQTDTKWKEISHIDVLISDNESS